MQDPSLNYPNCKRWTQSSGPSPRFLSLPPLLVLVPGFCYHSCLLACQAPENEEHGLHEAHSPPPRPPQRPLCPSSCQGLGPHGSLSVCLVSRGKSSHCLQPLEEAPCGLHAEPMWSCGQAPFLDKWGPRGRGGSACFSSIHQ